MAEVNTRKAYREEQEKAQRAAREREAKRIEVEKAYARQRRGKPEVTAARFDDVTFRKVNSLKKRLNRYCCRFDCDSLFGFILCLT